MSGLYMAFGSDIALIGRIFIPHFYSTFLLHIGPLDSLWPPFCGGPAGPYCWVNFRAFFKQQICACFHIVAE